MSKSNEIKLSLPLKKDNIFEKEKITDTECLKWLKDITKNPRTNEDITNEHKMYRYIASECLKRKICYHPVLQELAELQETNDKKPLQDTVKYPNNILIIELLKNFVEFKSQQIKDLPKATTPELKKQKFGLEISKKAIVKGIEIIKGLEFDITDSKQIKDYKGIGKGIMARVDEILSTNKLAELAEFNSKLKDSEVRSSSIEELKKIYGIGEVYAAKLYDEYNIKNIEELKDAVIKNKLDLNDNQLIGLEHYQDINQRIPRTEMDNFNNHIKDISKSIDTKLKVVIAGSYRRERPDSGDIDVLLTHPDIKNEEEAKNVDYISKFLDKLKEKDLLIANLGSGNTKFNGITKLTPKHNARRIDIRFVSYNSFYPALLYFTGSGNFNIEMRVRAKNMGYKLSEYNLYKIETKGKIAPGKQINKKDILKEIPVVVSSEKEIFDVLGMTYLEPKDREKGKN